MTQRYLRHKPSGIIHAYQDIYAIRPDFEEIIDVESRVIGTTVEIKGDTPAPKKARVKKQETVESVESALDAAVEE